VTLFTKRDRVEITESLRVNGLVKNSEIRTKIKGSEKVAKPIKHQTSNN